MLDVKRMRILKEVADRGSFSAAAEALSYTQSAVSQQIAALEREAGAQLVTRGSRGIKLKDMAEEPWINPTNLCSCSGLVRNACIRAGFEPQVSFESDDYQAVQGLVAAGVGVALIPLLALTTVRDDIVIRDLGREAPVRKIAAATLPGAQRSPSSRAMLDVLSEVASQYAKPVPHL